MINKDYYDKMTLYSIYGDNMENNKRRNKYFKYHKYGHNDGNYFKNKNYYKTKKYNKKNISNNILLQKENKMAKGQLTDKVFNDNLKVKKELEFNTVNEDSNYVPKMFAFKLALGIIVLVTLIFGVSLAYFNYYQEDSRQADIAGGEAYVNVSPSNAVNLTLSKLYPRTNAEARSLNNNYVDFTISAKNTSTARVLYYSLDITNGTDVANKVRISPEYIKVDLEEKVNNEYTYLQNAVSLSDFNFNDIVPANSNSVIVREFRLRMWVSEDVFISDTEEGATFTQSEFANLYANFHVSVNAYDKLPTCPGANCVYRKSATSKSKNDAIGTLGTDYETSYTNLGNYFLGHVLNSDGLTIKESYVCGINNGDVFCLKGGVNESTLDDKPVYVENVNRLNAAFTSCNATSLTNVASCTIEEEVELEDTEITINASGSVSIGNSCSVSLLGVSSCE